MNVLKLSALASLVGISGYANAIVSGSADVTVSGTLNGSNQCTIAIDGGAVLDSGIHHIADLPSAGGPLTDYQNYNVAVGCIFPTAIAIKYSTSLATSNTSRMGLYKTSSGKEAGHLYSKVGPNLPTAGGVEYAFAAIGDQDLSAISSADTFTVSPPETAISDYPGNFKNAYTIIDSNNNPVAATAFIFPFKIRGYTANKSTGWADEIADGIFSMSATVTLELHTI